MSIGRMTIMGVTFALALAFAPVAVAAPGIPAADGPVLESSRKHNQKKRRKERKEKKEREAREKAEAEGGSGDSGGPAMDTER